ncbi:hypothetical protein [Paenibacillus maysiensis]|uniref:hypothetical protein n=1 Tax=Paenibacillus maysiensis TaxID=1155954 RepID=UPI00046ED4CD|nr:hypothetical protein [Paenibacillus maysiensis]
MEANLYTTIKDSLVEHFYPKGWDIQKLAQCCSHTPDEAKERQHFWHQDFCVEPLDPSYSEVNDWRVKVGFELAMQIKTAKDLNQKIALLLTGYPLGQYQWTVYFLKDWGVYCDHVYSFGMEDWSDAAGQPSCMFSDALNEHFYELLGEHTVPEQQRFSATPEQLPLYEQKISEIQQGGGKLVTVYGIGRDFNIGFWEPHWAEGMDSLQAYKEIPYKIAGMLHPLTVITYAMTTFRSDFTAVPALANTVGLGLILKSDYMIGGCDRLYKIGNDIFHSWQGIALWATLRYGPDMWIPSSFIPTVPGKFFYPVELADVGHEER